MGQALEKLRPFAGAAHEHILVLQHGLEDAPRRFTRDEQFAKLVEVVAVVEFFERFENLVLAEAGMAPRLRLVPLHRHRGSGVA